MKRIEGMKEGERNGNEQKSDADWSLVFSGEYGCSNTICYD